MLRMQLEAIQTSQTASIEELTSVLQRASADIQFTSDAARSAKIRDEVELNILGEEVSYKTCSHETRASMV